MIEEKDRFGAPPSPDEPAFPRISLKDAKDRPFHRPTHLSTTVLVPAATPKDRQRANARAAAKASPARKPARYVAPPAPGKGVTWEQWQALRRYAQSLRDEEDER